MRASNRRFCSLSLTSSQTLISLTPPPDEVILHLRANLEKGAVLLLGAEPHNVFDAEAVVPTPVEDHDFTRGRKMLHVALHVHLRLLAVGGRGQGHESEHARADALGEGLDRAPLAGGVAALENDDHPQALVFDPRLELAQLTLELAQFLRVFLGFHIPNAVCFCFFAHK